MMTLSGHQMVRVGDLWVSRAPFTNIDWASNVERLWQGHRRYGVLVETRVNDEVRHSLHYASTLATLQDWFGLDRVKNDFGGRAIVANDDFTVAAFEFFVLERLGIDLLRHPVTRVTQFHAQGMCLVIGADLMTDDQYVKLVSGPDGRRKHATPNGELYGPDGEEQVVSGLKQRRSGTVDVEDLAFPTDPVTGTRHYTGLVWKWMKRNPGEAHQFGFRGGSWNFDVPEYFAASFLDDYVEPDLEDDDVGFLAARSAQDSR